MLILGTDPVNQMSVHSCSISLPTNVIVWTSINSTTLKEIAITSELNHHMIPSDWYGSPESSIIKFAIITKKRTICSNSSIPDIHCSNAYILTVSVCKQHNRHNNISRIKLRLLPLGKAIELMITDALLAADEHFGISKAVDNGEDYLNLTDDILRVIERSKEEELAPARQIMRRIRTRDLYKFVDEYLIPKDLIEFLGKVSNRYLPTTI